MTMSLRERITLHHIEQFIKEKSKKNKETQHLTFHVHESV